MGSETILTVEAPRGTTLKLADGRPGDIPIYAAFTRSAYYNGSRIPKPSFLVNYTFPPVSRVFNAPQFPKDSHMEHTVAGRKNVGALLF